SEGSGQRVFRCRQRMVSQVVEPSLQNCACRSTRTSPSTSLVSHCGGVEQIPQASRTSITVVWSGWIVVGRHRTPTSGLRSTQVVLSQRTVATASAASESANAARPKGTDVLYTEARKRER